MVPKIEGFKKRGPTKLEIDRRGRDSLGGFGSRYFGGSIALNK